MTPWCLSAATSVRTKRLPSARGFDRHHWPDRADENLLSPIEAHEREPLRILAYCLMGNHFHFVVWPTAAGQMSRFFRWLTLTHAVRWRVSHRTVGYGHLYRGRFKSFPVAEDDYRALFDALRADDRWPQSVLHLWNVAPLPSARDPLTIFREIWMLLRQWAGREPGLPHRLWVGNTRARRSPGHCHDAGTNTR